MALHQDSRQAGMPSVGPTRSKIQCSQCSSRRFLAITHCRTRQHDSVDSMQQLSNCRLQKHNSKGKCQGRGRSLWHELQPYTHWQNPPVTALQSHAVPALPGQTVWVTSTSQQPSLDSLCSVQPHVTTHAPDTSLPASQVTDAQRQQGYKDSVPLSATSSLKSCTSWQVWTGHACVFVCARC